MKNGLSIRTAVLALACLMLAGCVSPGPRIDANLLARYQQAVLRRSPQRRAGEEGRYLLHPLPGRMSIPLKIYRQGETNGRVAELSLDQAVRLALLNSVDISVVGFDPTITREQMVQAAAAFDFIVFGSMSHERTNRRRNSAALASKSREIPFEVGVRNTNIFGGTAELTWELTRNTDNIAATMPDPGYESVATLELTQPLLRLGGKDYNLATLHLAQLSHRVAWAQFRQKVEGIVTQVQVLYWGLIQVREDRRIQQGLLDMTINTLARVEKRKGIDATKAVIKQIEAAVESRRAALIRARKAVFDVQDQLARLLADHQLRATDDYAIKPTSDPVTTAVSIDMGEQLVDALKFNPALEQARLAIAAAEVNVRVARNEALPVLDLVASVGLQGLKGHGKRAAVDMFSGDYFEHSVGLTFEYPLGNRQARAAVRQRNQEKLKTIAEMQNIADQVAVSIKETIRRIQSAFEEMRAQTAAVAASQEYLAALNALEDKQALTPEFLQVKLQAQEALALARRAEIQTTVEFNNALAQLAQVTGTTLQQNNIKLAAEDIVTPIPVLRTLSQPTRPSPK